MNLLDKDYEPVLALRTWAALHSLELYANHPYAVGLFLRSRLSKNIIYVGEFDTLALLTSEARFKGMI